MALNRMHHHKATEYEEHYDAKMTPVEKHTTEPRRERNLEMVYMPTFGSME